MAFRFDKLTIKAQEAVAAAQSLAADAGQSAGRRRCTCWPRCWPRATGSSGRCSRRSASTAAQLERIVEAELAHLPKVSGGAQPQPDQELMQGASKRPQAEPTR